jgi:hypothetical protein
MIRGHSIKKTKQPHDAVYEHECIEDLRLMADDLCEMGNEWPLAQIREQFLTAAALMSHLRALYEQRLEARERTSA